MGSPTLFGRPKLDGGASKKFDWPDRKPKGLAHVALLQQRRIDRAQQAGLMVCPVKAIAAALVAVFGLTGPALAWGSEGHRIVAEIAEQYLEPATARQVRELLPTESATTLAQVSTWADEIRP
jgi:hypothetical protein